MKIEEYDTVLLKDGRKAAIVEILDSSHFLADIGDGPKDWDTIEITLGEIGHIVKSTECSRMALRARK
ncbi:hypothetical protein [Lacticaseibacillus saniviri]|uniref:hypothetical protein n=1 Tax=Lacticaseibacillus saniviri TaxID=931533 RepID=UPI0007054F27|nr:hypothetical protein [Lacticaseibacillus saniviri]